MKTKLFFGIILSVFIVLTAGCKKKDQHTLSTKLIEPEQLVSMPEAIAITGNTYTDKGVKENAIVGQKICFYENSNNDLFQVSLIQKAFIASNSGLQEPKAYYDPVKQVFSNIEPLTGVGDEAFYIPSPASALHLMCSGYYINIIIMKGDRLINGDWTPEAKRAIYINAGKKACENLKKILSSK